MHRHALTDGQWARLQRVLPGQRTGPTSTLGDRLFVEAVLYRAKTGLPWRDLPERFGPWKSVYNRFANWARKGHFAVIVREPKLEADDSGSIVDGLLPQSQALPRRRDSLRKDRGNYLAPVQLACSWLWLR